MNIIWIHHCNLYHPKVQGLPGTPPVPALSGVAMLNSTLRLNFAMTLWGASRRAFPRDTSGKTGTCQFSWTNLWLSWASFISDRFLDPLAGDHGDRLLLSTPQNLTFPAPQMVPLCKTSPDSRILHRPMLVEIQRVLHLPSGKLTSTLAVVGVGRLVSTCFH